MNPNTLVKDLMTTALIMINADEKISKVKVLFEQNNFHHLPVVEENRKLVGIISKEDFYQFTYMLSLQTTGETLSKIKYNSVAASDIMTKSPFTLDPDDTIGLAADIFLVNQFHALPVVESGELCGILTTHDLLKYAFKSAVTIGETSIFDDNRMIR